MDFGYRKILDEYHQQKQDFINLGDIVSNLLKKDIDATDITPVAIEHRVKEEKSLTRKLEIKGDKYISLDDITDILGVRVVCCFADEVDTVAESVKKLFVIDWDNSVDKRKALNVDSFGYLSMHFICSLPRGAGYAEELCSKKFEVQIRSLLQHTWSVINHDLGYKTESGIPRTIQRNFARMAGLLEIADDQFIDIRKSLNIYSQEIREKISSNKANSVPIDLVSLNEYVHSNSDMRKFINDIAGICDADIRNLSVDNYIEQLEYLGMHTIGDVQKMLFYNSELAYKLAKQVLADSETKVLSSSIGLRFLCRAYMLNNNYGLERIVEFLNISIKDIKRAGSEALELMKQHNRICGEE